MTENGRWNSFLKETGHFKNQNKVSKVTNTLFLGLPGLPWLKNMADFP